MTFKFLSFADLLQMPPETGEQGYRRGYHQGYVQGLMDACNNQSVPLPLWHFWSRTLAEWSTQNTDRFIAPPHPQAEEKL